MAETILNYATLERKYNSAASTWRRKLSAMGYPDAYMDMLSTLTLEKRGLNVLDVGAGSGAFSEALTNVLGPLERIDLIDISANMLVEARVRLNQRIASIHTVCGPLEALKADKKYDLILCAHVVEHCADSQVALAILRSALAPDGQLLLVASKPHWCTSLIRFIWKHKAFTPAEMTDLLTRAGYSDINQYRFPKGPPQRTSAGYTASNLNETTKEMS